MSAFYARFGKRGLDLILVIPGILLLSPLYIILAALVRRKLGKPVFFRQDRPGRNTQIFRMMKFRTMTDATDPSGRLLGDTERLTTFGARLRTTSLDELPELFNVLRGDMSLVGPRPLLTRYTPYFTESEQARFAVRPGITGLAQVNGRNDASWDERIAMDVEYVNSMSLWLDLKILVRTFAIVVNKDGLRVDPGAVYLDFDIERQLRAEKEKVNG